jgi:hypothetical protein
MSVLAWNRWFLPVPWRIVAVLLGFVVFYQADTLFTTRVDFPGNLAFVADPWKALHRPSVSANTGIVFTELGPWTMSARRSITHGALPLWNRTTASGAALAANQQTAIFHPFTIAGLVLPMGEAWTLSVTLRLFWVLFFMFILLRNWGLHELAATFGSVAYAFCTFHVIWLLFPLGLATMAAPMALAGADELARRPRWRSYALLVMGLALAVLGGHPESAAFVGVLVGCYSVYVTLVQDVPLRIRVARLLAAAGAAVTSVVLTAFFWYPTFLLLPNTERFKGFSSFAANPVDHHIGADWMLPLLTPNLLGTVQAQNYQPPQPIHSAILFDYGEVASGYAGVVTIALALALLRLPRRRPFWFFAIAGVVVFLTMFETPGWYSMVRHIPILGIALHQRLRFVWALSMCVCAAIGLDAMLADRLRTVEGKRATMTALAVVTAIYLFSSKTLLARHMETFALEQWLAAALALVILGFTLRRIASEDWPISHLGIVATGLAFAELLFVTRGYNPPALPRDIYPNTGAIAVMRRENQPVRMAALGWSFIPDTPGYYGLEDVKTTDPMHDDRYTRVLKTFLKINPGDYDQTIGDVRSPFFDYLNIGLLYVPPRVPFDDHTFWKLYDGPDGRVYKNLETLPRYQLIAHFEVHGSLDDAIARMSTFSNFRDIAVVDHVPRQIRHRDIAFFGEARDGQAYQGNGGSLRLVSYGPNRTVLRVQSNGWNLLASSDVNIRGWRVYWNGQRLPPVNVNGAFLGTFVPPGTGTLELRYWPDDFERGVKVAALGLFLVTAAGLTHTVMRRSR